METIDRYTWEDALIKAEGLDLLPPGAVNLALRLASAITWNPKGKPSGLYWKNSEALESVNSSVGTYKRYRKVLFETGFLTQIKGNLIPQVPTESHIETLVEAKESHIETREVAHCDSGSLTLRPIESQIDTPYSVDIYSGDSFSDDSYSEGEPVVPTVSPNQELPLVRESTTSLNQVDEPADCPNAVDDARESQSETKPERDGAFFMAKKRAGTLTPEDQQEWDAFGRAYIKKIEDARRAEQQKRRALVGLDEDW